MENLFDSSSSSERRKLGDGSDAGQSGNFCEDPHGIEPGDAGGATDNPQPSVVPGDLMQSWKETMTLIVEAKAKDMVAQLFSQMHMNSQSAEQKKAEVSKVISAETGKDGKAKEAGVVIDSEPLKKNVHDLKGGKECTTSTPSK
eukprot:5540032-Ditylum_brightwellii.AAC.1